MAGGINSVTISGNMTRDPELRALPSGTSVCEIGVAVNSRVKENDQWVDRPDFIDVTIWGGQGENVAKYLHRGSYIVITGRLRQDRWEQDGQNRSKVKVVAEKVDFGPKVDGGGGGGSAPQSDVPSDTSGFTHEPTPSTYGQKPAGADDDIPF